MDIRGKVIKAISEQSGVPVDSISDEKSLTELDLDLLDIAELSVSIDEVFNIDVGDDDFENWETVGDVILTVEALHSANGDCDLCGVWSGALVEGECKPCRVRNGKS